MNTQPKTQKTRYARKAVVLLAAFALLAAACSGSETVTETSGAGSRDAPVVNVEPDANNGDSDTDTSADSTPDETGSNSDAADGTATGGVNADGTETIATSDGEGEGHTHDDEGGHTQEEEEANLDLVSDDDAIGGLTEGEAEAAIQEQEAQQAAVREPAPRPQVEANAGPDGVTYDPDYVRITSRSGTIHTHRWGDEYFLAERSCEEVSAGCGFRERDTFIGLRAPLGELVNADYTPQPDITLRHAERGLYTNQWLDDVIPLKPNLDLRIRNTITGEVEHWRIVRVETFRGHLGYQADPVVDGNTYGELPSGLGIRDKSYSHEVYYCHYATDGVEFPAGYGIAGINIAREIPTESGGHSGLGWFPTGRNHHGWGGGC